MLLNWHVEKITPRLKIIKLMQAFLFSLFAIFLLPISAFAQAKTNPSGLEVPRFSSTRSKPINVRVGPGKKYKISWIYVKSAIPIEVIQEFDVWRKIRDVEGEEGWIHQSLVSSARIAQIKSDIVAPVALLSMPETGAKILANLNADYQVPLKKCDGEWCEAKITYKVDGQREKTVSGYILQSSIWGVYENEKFD